MLRQWLVEELAPRSVYECYGAGGLGTSVWHAAGVKNLSSTTGDALDALRSLGRWDFDVYDVDPHSSPFEAIAIIAANARRPRIGLFVTDGCLRQEAKIRGYWPKILVEVMGWDEKLGKNGWDAETKRFKTWVYWQYPEVVRAIYERLLAPRYRLTDIRLVLARGHAIANYAALCCEETA